MSAWLLIAVAIAYTYVAAQYFYGGRIGLGIAFLAYALSNIGFMLDLYKK